MVGVQRHPAQQREGHANDDHRSLFHERFFIVGPCDVRRLSLAPAASPNVLL